MPALAPGPLAAARTLADVVRQLGGVPLDRVRWSPTPGTATVADLLTADGCELIDGTLVEKAVGHREARLNSYLGAVLYGFVRDRNLGVVADSEGGVELADGLVRKPDVGYISWARYPDGPAADVAYPAVAPDLAVEVLSPTNTAGEMRRKRGEYFAAGTAVVWGVDPGGRTVAVYTGPDDHRTLAAGDVLDGGAVLTGFAVPVADVFAELDRRRPASGTGGGRPPPAAVTPRR